VYSEEGGLFFVIKLKLKQGPKRLCAKERPEEVRAILLTLFKQLRICSVKILDLTKEEGNCRQLKSPVMVDLDGDAPVVLLPKSEASSEKTPKKTKGL